MLAENRFVEPSRRLRVLAVTRLFPNPVEPLAAPFQRRQLAALATFCDVSVVASLPLLPGARWLGPRTRVGRLSDAPLHEDVDGLDVLHPRIPYVPGTGTLPALAPLNLPLYLAGLARHVPTLWRAFDVVLGTFLYPDACAAALLARVLGIPYVVKAHGTDVNEVSRWPSLRKILGHVLRGAAFSLGVSPPLVDRLIELGALPNRTGLLANGVDRNLFHPRDRARERAALALPRRGRIVLFVGRLEQEKGLVELREAFDLLARTSSPAESLHFVVVGFGALERELGAFSERVAARGQGSARFLVVGGQPPERVARYLGASDVVAVPSFSEGTPNVVLEALASGRPVVASAVGGIPYVIDHRRTGLLVPPGDSQGLSAALRDALSRAWDETALVRAAPPSWERSAEELHERLRFAAASEGSRKTGIVAE